MASRRCLAATLLLSTASLAHGFGLASLTMVRNGPQPKRVAIIGAGPAGLSAAIALRHFDTGVETVRIFEQKELVAKRDIGGGVQLNGGAAVLAKLGLAEDLHAAAQPMERILSRSADGTQLFDFNLPGICRAVPHLRCVRPGIKVPDPFANALRECAGE